MYVRTQDFNLGDDEARVPEDLFCDAMEFGLPPTAGWGMGIDRMVQLLTGMTHIREVVAFPMVRPLQSEHLKSHSESIH